MKNIATILIPAFFLLFVFTGILEAFGAANTIITYLFFSSLIMLPILSLVFTVTYSDRKDCGENKSSK